MTCGWVPWLNIVTWAALILTWLLMLAQWQARRKRKEDKL